MVKTYYVKNKNDICAVMTYDEDRDLYSMEIQNTILFRGKVRKIFFTDQEVRQWMEDRLTPEYQGGYKEKMTELGISVDDSEHRSKLFWLTRGCKCNDMVWVAYTEDEPFENSPLYEAGYR